MRFRTVIYRPEVVTAEVADGAVDEATKLGSERTVERYMQKLKDANLIEFGGDGGIQGAEGLRCDQLFKPQEAAAVPALGVDGEHDVVGQGILFGGPDDVIGRVDGITVPG